MFQKDEISFFQGRQSSIEYVLSDISGAADLQVRFCSKTRRALALLNMCHAGCLWFYYFDTSIRGKKEQDRARCVLCLRAQQSPVIPKAFLAKIVSDWATSIALMATCET